MPLGKYFVGNVPVLRDVVKAFEDKQSSLFLTMALSNIVLEYLRHSSGEVLRFITAAPDSNLKHAFLEMNSSNTKAHFLR